MRAFRGVVIAVATGLIGCEARHPGRDAPAVGIQARIVFHGDSTTADFGCVTLHGVPTPVLQRVPPEAWPRVLRVTTLAAGSSAAHTTVPAVLGTYEIASGVLRFRPRFAFDPGMTYAARFDGAALDSLHEATLPRATPSQRTTFVMPTRAARPATRVDAIYPSARQLPENVLRFYVHFSAPMRAKDIHARVHLYDDSGGEVRLAFVEVPHGLWDPAQQRLTLFLHPGRIKRGVGPNRTLGAPLRAGARYRLVIDAEARDATGQPLAVATEKVFDVVAADRTSPEPDDWRLVPPTSRDSGVALVFPEPLDHALLQRWIGVIGPDDRSVQGSVRIDDDERRWTFTPAAPWRKGSYTVRVHPALEDLAGNTVQRLFDTETPASASTGAPSNATTMEAGPGAAPSPNDTEPLQFRFTVRGVQFQSPAATKPPQ